MITFKAFCHKWYCLIVLNNSSAEIIKVYKNLDPTCCKLCSKRLELGEFDQG